MNEHEPPTVDDRSSSDEERPDSTRIAWPRLVTIIKIGIVAAVATVFLGVGAFAAASFYSEYGAVRNGPNAESWGGLPPQYAGQASCTSCHATETAIQDASTHVNVSCENCHGPLATHASSDDAARASLPAKPTSETCATCHVAAVGRPSTFPQVDPTWHYSGDQCLRCHDPHSIVAIRPPMVSHPLANLPECTTCHAPDGLKKIPAGHEPAADPICLSCHGHSANQKP